MVACNSTLTDQIVFEEPVVGQMTFHIIVLIVSASAALIATVLSLWLIFKHALNYVYPWEQKQ